MAQNNVKYGRTEFELTLTIGGTGGTTFKDVVGISANFGVNSIPTAVVQVAAGKNVGDGELATIQKNGLNSLQPRAKAKVTLTVKNNSTPTVKAKDIPDGDHVIFDGYYAGFGYQRSTTTALYTIHLLHWIDDLNCSSVLNGNWFQGAPHDLAQAAVPSLLRDPGSGAFGVTLAPTIGGDFLTQRNISTDLWGATLKPIFEALAAMPPVATQDDFARGQKNDAALAALARMPGDAPTPSKLPMTPINQVDGIVSNAMLRDGLAHMIKSGLAYTSFWSKLVGEMGSSFLFGISPAADFANVIPYFGGLSKTWRVIELEDYNYANFNTQAATLIESIDIFYMARNAANYPIGGDPRVPPPISFYAPLGRFPKGNARNMRGNILIREPPPWCTMFAPLSALAQFTMQLYQDTHTGVGAGANGPAPSAPEAEKNIKTSGLLDKYAEHWYKSAILGQRTGELSGRLRFDIAPGSIVQIQTDPESGVGSADDRLSLYAMVTQVSYVINAEQHTAGTSFTFSCVRNSEENKNQNFTSPTPPLYEQGWSGGPLVKTAFGTPEINNAVLGNVNPAVGGLA